MGLAGKARRIRGRKLPHCPFPCCDRLLSPWKKEGEGNPLTKDSFLCKNWHFCKQETEKHIHSFTRRRLGKKKFYDLTHSESEKRKQQPLSNLSFPLILPYLHRCSKAGRENENKLVTASSQKKSRICNHSRRIHNTRR